MRSFNPTELINGPIIIRCLPILLSDRDGCGTIGAARKSSRTGLYANGVETRASIAQDLEGGNEGARDRVVTGFHMNVP